MACKGDSAVQHSMQRDRYTATQEARAKLYCTEASPYFIKAGKAHRGNTTSMVLSLCKTIVMQDRPRHSL